ncbi:MAG TPA: zinc-binding dehydrogenase, partial [Gaiellaceae bacterium]|nr:zinc-binding dehydrogenase [Gaiellaceae bacterium]
FAVQIAVALGARVVGTASAANEEFVRGLGAEFLDYRARRIPANVDAALDPIGGETLELTKRVAARVVSIVEPGVGHAYHYVRPDGAQLAEIGRMLDEGRLRVHVQQSFPLEDAVAAHELLEAGHVRGKLVLTV